MNRLSGMEQKLYNYQPVDIPVEHMKSTVNQAESQNYNARIFIPNDSKSSENITKNYYTDAVRGIQETGRVNSTFFHKNNIDNIHQKIIQKVKLDLGEVISRQDDTQLHLIMRSIFLQHGRETNDIMDMINCLNNRVINYSVDKIKENILQYRGYLKDISTPRTIMSYPTPTIEGNKSVSFSDRNDIF